MAKGAVVGADGRCERLRLTGAVGKTTRRLRAIGHLLTYPKRGDFLVDGEFLFEVGIGNKIPLWLFGFLY